MKRHTFFFVTVLINLLVLSVSLPSFSGTAIPLKGEYFNYNKSTLCPRDKVSFIEIDSKGNLTYFNMKGIRRMIASAKSPNKDSYLLLLAQGVKRGYSVGVTYPGKFDCSVRQESKLEPLSLTLGMDK